MLEFASHYLALILNMEFTWGQQTSNCLLGFWDFKFFLSGDIVGKQDLVVLFVNFVFGGF